MFETGDFGLPPAGGEVWYFPGATTSGGQADIIAYVYRRDGSSWIACLGHDRMRLFGGEPLFAMPDGERLYIAGGIVDRDDPKGWRPLAGIDQRHRVDWSPDRSIVTFSDYSGVEAHGPRGRLWHTVLGSDIGVRKVLADRVICTVYDFESGDEVERVIESRLEMSSRVPNAERQRSHLHQPLRPP